MEALVKEKVLEQFVNTPTTSIVETQPVNIDITQMSVNRMVGIETLISNDGNFFIRYGGVSQVGYYNAIEVYSIQSIQEEQILYKFDDLQINSLPLRIRSMKQSEDGRFYAVGNTFDSNNNDYYYFIIFNNFIQDGYISINKYYSATSLGFSQNDTLYNVAKERNGGVYYFIRGNSSTSNSELVKLEINIIEGNKVSTAIISDVAVSEYASADESFEVLGSTLIYTKLWEDEENYTEKYSIATLNLNEEIPSRITFSLLYSKTLTSSTFLSSNIKKYTAIVPYLNSSSELCIDIINLAGNVKTLKIQNRTFTTNNSLYIYVEKNYLSISTGAEIYLYNVDYNTLSTTEFYFGSFSKFFVRTSTLNQYNLSVLIGITGGTDQTITFIKNIYSPNVTSEPYYNYNFCIPYYMNLYSNSNNNTSLIFSRNATERFYSGNQLTASFNVPNYLLNDGNIEKANVYGQTNYLINSQIQDFEKNRFESLYFNFIYNLNVIDNTNGLSVLNTSGSNRLANSLWNRFDKDNTRLSKARITYEDLATEIIDLNISEVVGESVTFSYFVNGNITKIEYLSDDEKTVYATFRTDIEDRSYNLITENNEDILTEQGIELLGEEAYTITQTITIN